jgi:hypothetical protein
VSAITEITVTATIDPFIGTFAWAIEAARCGHAIRRACWPFWWVLVPTDVAGIACVSYTALLDGRPPLSSCIEDELMLGSRQSWALPVGDVLDPCWTKPVAVPNRDLFDPVADISAEAATDWQICTSELPCQPLAPGLRLRVEDSIMLGSGRIVALDGTPEALPGYRKIVAFVPVDA